MNNVVHAKPAASSPRGLAHAIATVTSVIEAAAEVFAEAGAMSAKARDRFPLAD